MPLIQCEFSKEAFPGSSKPELRISLNFLYYSETLKLLFSFQSHRSNAELQQAAASLLIALSADGRCSVCSICDLILLNSAIT